MRLRALILVAALCGIAIPTAKAESLQRLERKLHSLQSKVTYAKRFAAHDRVVIRGGYDWTVLGPEVEQLIQHAKVDAHREHLALMLRVIRRAEVRLRAVTLAWRAARRPPHYVQWLCLKRYEGSWQDAGAPYYGGLQMDIGFQRRYGSHLLATKGTANNWTPLEQMWVAERAHDSGRGFGPWPQTRRYCGI